MNEKREKALKKFLERTAAALIAAAFVLSAAIPCRAATNSEAKEDLPYFYNFLTNQEKTIYVSLRRGIMENKEKIDTIPFYSSEVYRRICELIMYNDDLTFNLAGLSGSTTGGKSTFEARYSVDNYTYKLMRSELEEAADKVSKEALKIKSEYDRIAFIHDYIAENTVYGHTYASSDGLGFEHYAYGALVEGVAVCQGYSAAFTYLCRKSGIECINVYGISKGEYHSWNKVLCDKKWYNVDVTWDDPVSNFKENITHDYFMLSDSDFAKDHTADAITGTEIISDESRGYYTENDILFEKNSDAYSYCLEMLTEAAKEKRNSLSLNFANETAYNNMIRYLEYKNRLRLKRMLGEVKKASGADILTDSTWYFKNDDSLRLTIVLVYKESKLSDYFILPEAVKDPEKYEKIGIIADIPKKDENDDKQ